MKIVILLILFLQFFVKLKNWNFDLGGSKERNDNVKYEDIIDVTNNSNNNMHDIDKNNRMRDNRSNYDNNCKIRLHKNRKQTTIGNVHY